MLLGKSLSYSSAHFLSVEKILSYLLSELYYRKLKSTLKLLKNCIILFHPYRTFFWP